MTILKYPVKLQYIPSQDIYLSEIHFSNDTITHIRIKSPTDISVKHSIDPSHLLRSTCSAPTYSPEIQLCIVNSIEAALDFKPSHYLNSIRTLYLGLNHLSKDLYIVSKLFGQLGHVKIHSALSENYKFLQNCLGRKSALTNFFPTLFPNADVPLIPRGFIDCFFQFYNTFRPILNHTRQVMLKNKILINRLGQLAAIGPSIIPEAKQTAPARQTAELSHAHRETIIPGNFTHLSGQKEIKGVRGDCWDRYWRYFCAIERNLQLIRESIHVISDLSKATLSLLKDFKFTSLSRNEQIKIANEKLACHATIISQHHMSIQFQRPGWQTLSIIKQILPGQIIDDLIIILNSVGFQQIPGNKAC